MGLHKDALEALLWVRRQGTKTMPEKEQLHKIARAYAACCDYDKAYLYQDSAYVASDSLFNKNMADAIAHWNAEFENREHLLEIETIKADRLQLTVWLLIVAAAVVLLVIAIVAQRRRLKRKAETQAANKYVEGLENERSRLSKELHDGVCNDLLGVQMLAQLAKKPEEQQEMIEQLQRTREDVRRISHDLASPVMDQTPFADMVERYVDRFRKGTDKEINLNIEIEKEIDPEMSTQRYRIIQELTANAVKHSSGKKIKISISSSSKGVGIRIDSDGMPEMKSRTHGLGMVSIRNRVAALGGTVINTSDAEGYHSQIDIII